MNNFPYDSFPYRLDHKEKPNTICWFQCEEHMEKYIERHKLKKKDYELSTNNVETLGKGNRRKGAQKRPRSRQSSDT